MKKCIINKIYFLSFLTRIFAVSMSVLSLNGAVNMEFNSEDFSMGLFNNTLDELREKIEKKSFRNITEVDVNFFEQNIEIAFFYLIAKRNNILQVALDLSLAGKSDLLAFDARNLSKDFFSCPLQRNSIKILHEIGYLNSDCQHYNLLTIEGLFVEREDLLKNPKIMQTFRRSYDLKEIEMNPEDKKNHFLNQRLSIHFNNSESCYPSIYFLYDSNEDYKRKKYLQKFYNFLSQMIKITVDPNYDELPNLKESLRFIDEELKIFERQMEQGQIEENEDAVSWISTLSPRSTTDELGQSNFDSD